jgi:hypothetical protein
LDENILRTAFKEPFTESRLPFPRQKGKVRDVYQLAPGRLLMITTDRLSAFDRVLGSSAVQRPGAQPAVCLVVRANQSDHPEPCSRNTRSQRPDRNGGETFSGRGDRARLYHRGHLHCLMVPVQPGRARNLRA